MAIPPIGARRRFGADVRKSREQAGLSQSQLARSALTSQSMVSALEGGRKTTGREQIARLDAALSTEGALLRRWENLNRGDGFPDWFRGIVPVEREASEIKEYQPLVIPGLLQTEDYARASIRQGRPTDTNGEIDDLVRARMERQEILRAERGPRLRVVVEEHVLRRPIGGRATMRTQLDHLHEISARPRIGVYVVPMSTEAHPGQDGAFMLFTVPGKGSVSYTETRVSGSPMDDPDTVADYVGVFGELCMVALPPAPSRALMTEIRREHEQ